MLDEISQAVLSRDEVARYLRGAGSAPGDGTRDRIYAYLEELRTTQRYALYRSLKHPLYPILRKIDRVVERIDIPRDVTARTRVIYVSNHKSHIDYLVQPLLLDDFGVRPPIIAAGINLFGGALGLIHRHVTGAIPIRRNAKDPAYLVTLKAYIAELLKLHDLFFYVEGGRSYTGELKAPKTGLMHAALLAERADIVIIPCAVAYDLILEDRVLAHQGVKREQRPFSREIAEMVGSAVGYQSRAIVTFGDPISLRGRDPQSRRDVLDLARDVRAAIGRLYKVVPSALVARALRPSMPVDRLRDEVGGLIDQLRTRDANLDAVDAVSAVDRGLMQLELRGVLVPEGRRIRVRDRHVLRYYARTIQHLFEDAAPDPDDAAE